MFVSYEAWTCLITVRVQFKVSVFVIYLCYASVMIILCCCYASITIMIWFCYIDVTVLLCLCYTSIETTEKNDDNSEIMSTPIPKYIKQLVDKEKKTNRLAIGMMKVCAQLFNYYFVYYCLICIALLWLNFFNTIY